MDISKIIKSVFTILALLTFIFLITSAYRQYQRSAELALLGDAACCIATGLALDELALEDQGAERAYVVDPAKFTSIGDFTRPLGGENYRFCFEVGYPDGRETVLGPFGETHPDGVMKVSLSLPVAVFENARLHGGRLKVVVWR